MHKTRNLVDSNGRFSPKMAMFRKTFTPSIERGKEKDGEILDIDYRRKVDPSFRDSFGRSQIHLLLLQGYDVPDELDYIISNGCEVNQPDCEHNFPIKIAADKGLAKCTKKLISRNSLLDVFNDSNVTPLMMAAVKGYSEVTSSLLQNGANPNLPNAASETSLHYAVMGGHVETVKLILDVKGKVNKTDINGVSPLTLASKLGHSQVVKLLLSYPCVPKINPNLTDSFGRTSLHWASAQGLVDIVTILCESGIDLDVADKHHNTPFILAIRNSQAKVIEVLLRYKADRTTPDGLNGTCIGLAALFGHHECVEVLLRAGEDPNETSYFGSTALIASVFESHSKTVQILLSAGADPNRVARAGISPLLKSFLGIKPHVNEVARHCIVQTLIRYGSDVNAKMSTGMCATYLRNFFSGKGDAMSFAMLSGYTSLVTLLLISGYKVKKSWMNEIENGPLSSNGLFAIADILAPIKSWLEQPRLLSHLARGVVRDAIGIYPKEKIENLEIAWKLKKYLQFEEFEHIAITRVEMKGELPSDAVHMINIQPCVMDRFKGTLIYNQFTPREDLCTCSFCKNYK